MRALTKYHDCHGNSSAVCSTTLAKIVLLRSYGAQMVRQSDSRREAEAFLVSAS